MISNILVPRLGTDSNLDINGTYDILLVQTPTFPVGTVTFGYSTPSPTAITGIQKCAQFFLKLLFTTKGSDLVNQEYGTILPSLLIGANANLTSPELVSSITGAVQDAVTQCTAILNTTDNDISSSISVVNVLSIDQVSVDGFTIMLQLTTLAGDSGIISLPYPLLDYPLYSGT